MDVAKRRRTAICHEGDASGCLAAAHALGMTRSAGDQELPRDAVFVSYSRREFYFAESLALHLQARGVATWFDVQRLHWGVDWREGIRQGLEMCPSMVVVASRASLASPYVQEEWKAALGAGKPVHVAVVEGVALPPDLDSGACSICDFQRDFEDALTRLVQAINLGMSRQAPALRAEGSSIPRRLPRNVQAVAIGLLAVPLLILTIVIGSTIHALAALPQQSGVDFENTVVLITMFGTMYGALSCWGIYLGWSFVRRRFSFVDVRYAALGQPLLALMVAWFATVFGAWGLPRPLGQASLLVAGGLVILGLYNYFWALGRSADVYRWMPTGQAPQELRLQHAHAILGTKALTGGSSWRTAPFQLHYTPADEVVAQKVKNVVYYGSPYIQPKSSLRERTSNAIRSRIGSTPSPDTVREFTPSPAGPTGAPPERTGPHHVVILSNKTPTAWVDAILSTYGKVIAVVASGIRIPDDISKLTRYQWVDYRSQTDAQLSVLALYLRNAQLGQSSYILNPVPEALRNHVVPGRVRWLARVAEANTGLYFGLAAVAVLFVLVDGESFVPSQGILALVAAGLLQFWAVGTALARGTSRELITAVLTVSLIVVAVSGTFELQSLVLPAAFIIGFWRACGDWLPSERSTVEAGSTLALPAREVWIRHLLIVAMVALYFSAPFALTAVTSVTW